MPVFSLLNKVGNFGQFILYLSIGRHLNSSGLLLFPIASLSAFPDIGNVFRFSGYNFFFSLLNLTVVLNLKLKFASLAHQIEVTVIQLSTHQSVADDSTKNKDGTFLKYFGD